MEYSGKELPYDEYVCIVGAVFCVNFFWSFLAEREGKRKNIFQSNQANQEEWFLLLFFNSLHIKRREEGE